jgi:hypothetical protein
MKLSDLCIDCPQAFNNIVQCDGAIYIVFNQIKTKSILITSLFLLTLEGCSGDLSANPNQPPVPMGRNESRKRDYGNLFGDDFLVLGGPKKPGESGTPTAYVNTFIWRASLDTLSFMPLSSADAVGGVIVTDWYTAPNTSHERIKVTVYVTSPQLRADAIRVTLYKQILKGGTWVNVPANPASATEMENIILSKARQLRVKSLGEKK